MTRDRQHSSSPNSRRNVRGAERRTPIPRFSPPPPANKQSPPPQLPPRPQKPSAPQRPSPLPPAVVLPVATTQHPVAPPSPGLQRTVPLSAQPQDDGTPAQDSWLRSLYQSWWLGWTRSWAFWWTFAALSTAGLGLLSAAVLLKLPALPNCPAIFWPTASASLRMYCAELAANKRTVDDLLEAIELVNRLPDDHPLRPEIDRLIEVWAADILTLADELFDQGKLNTAIATARKIPPNTSAHGEVEEQIKQWNDIWAQGERIYSEAEAALRKEDFRGAFTIASRLLQVPNTYWQTQKYNQLNNLITITRQDGAKLAEARALMDGGVDDVLKAIQLARQVRKESYVYGEAQTLIIELGRQIIELAEDALNRQDYDGAIAILKQLPDNIAVGSEADDFMILAQAQSKAWQGTATSLEEAILHARRLQRGRPLYDKAQGLIRQWQLEIQDLALLSNAKSMATSSSTSNLQAAIAEAQRVPYGNPRWDEAQDLIADWTATIEAIEDRPYLERARQIAAAGDVNSLQAAINEASRIQSGRALSGEAEDLIYEWRDRLQRIQDQPYLDQARRLAQQGDLQGAIATAQQIQSGRSLYSDAQADIASWQANIDGQLRMQEAYQIAASNTANALVSAIQTAERVPTGSTSRADADRMIESWSRTLLTIAQQESIANVRQAIATAESIPASTAAYTEAQRYIQQWQDLLRPIRLESPSLQTAPNPAAPSNEPAGNL